MNRLYYLISLISIVSLFSACTEEPTTDLSLTNLIPLPAEITANGGNFYTDKVSTISYAAGLANEAQYLQGEWKRILDTALTLDSNMQKKNTIYLSVDPELKENKEAYKIEIAKKRIDIIGASNAGVFYGIQTLSQLASMLNEGETIATGIISDSPTYAYRGSMLDVSRHFFSQTDVFRYIDLISRYKINHLHLHLSDDQGWRIEIKSWPNLTAHGGSTEVGGGEGGFYTQEEYTEIVDYAASRHITIVPEIDMPGHTNSALASYPELNCDNKARELYTGTEVGFSTLCTDNEITYQFVDDVIREISELTPGPYFHIGGDESHVTPLDKYIPFINRVSEITNKYGKQVIGWDEISHASLPEGSVVQYWANAENAVRGINQGTKVLMSPATRTYIDMQYDSTTKLGLHWAAYIEIDSSYIWDPAQFEDEIKREHILGIESPLWSETITNMDEIEYMAFPRLISHAEIGWSIPEKRKWDDFKVRLGNHATILRNLDIDFYASDQIPWTKE